MENNCTTTVNTIKCALPQFGVSFIKKAVDQGLTIQNAREIADLASSFDISPHHLIVMKRNTGLSNDDLLNILQAWEETHILSIRSLRKLYDLCDRDSDMFEHAMELVLEYVIKSPIRKKWRMVVSSRMAHFLEKLHDHITMGGGVFDFQYDPLPWLN